MLPATGSLSSQEMKVAYFISAVPGWLVYLSAMAAVALMVLVPLHLMRKKVPALLTFGESEFRVAEKRKEIVIPYAKLARVLVSDLKDGTGFPRGMLQISLECGKGRFANYERKVFLLKNYEEGGEFLDQLSKVDIDLKYEDSISPMMLDE